MKSSSKIVGLGELLWDVYPDTRYPGGAPANAAFHCSKMGFESYIASAVGEDSAGEDLVQFIKQSGIHTDCIQRYAGKPTATVKVKLDKRGIPQFECSTDTAFDYLDWTENLADLANSSDAVIFGTLAQRQSVSKKTIQRYLAETKAIKVFDMNLRGWDHETEQVVRETMKQTDVLKLNLTELNYLRKMHQRESRSIAHFLDELIQKYGLKLAALTLGSRGCLISNGKERIASPGFVVNPVDTTGCGDAFTAALIVNFVKENSLEEIAECANLMGAFLATKKGAVPEYEPEEIRCFRINHQKRIRFNL